VHELSLTDLRSGLEDLLERRLPALERVPNGTWFASQFRTLRGAIAALPADTDALPLALRLRALDATHDAWGRALHHLVVAVEELPGAGAAAMRAAATVRAHYMTGLVETRSGYLIEAGRAQHRRATLAADAVALKAVSTPDGRTLDVWVERYIAAGEALAEALSGRSDEAASPSAADARTSQSLRSELIALIGDLRAVVRLALRADPSLPRTLEDDVIGAFLERQRLAEQRATTSIGIPAMPDD